MKGSVGTQTQEGSILCAVFRDQHDLTHCLASYMSTSTLHFSPSASFLPATQNLFCQSRDDLSWPVCFHTCCSLSLECLFSFYLYPTKFDSSLKWDLLKCHLLCEACVPVNFELNSVVAGYHITCGFASGTPWREVCFYICLKIYQSVWHVLGLQ